MGDELIVNFTKPLVGSYETAGSVVPAESQKVIFNFGDKQEAVTDKNTSNPPNYSPKSFDVFPKGNKDNAYNEYKDTQTRVGNAFTMWNSSHAIQLIVDYSDFPIPEDFAMKKPNKNKDGFDMYLKALASWENTQMTRLQAAAETERQRQDAAIEKLQKTLDSMYSKQEQMALGINTLIEKLEAEELSMQEVLEQLKTIGDRVCDLDDKLDNVEANQDTIIQKEDAIQQTTGNIRGTQVSTNKENQEKERLRYEIFLSMHNDVNVVKQAIRETIRDNGKRYDHYTHSDLQEETILEIVNTMSLAELQTLRKKLKTPESDPLVRK